MERGTGRALADMSKLINALVDRVLSLEEDVMHLKIAKNKQDRARKRKHAQ